MWPTSDLILCDLLLSGSSSIECPLRRRLRRLDGYSLDLFSCLQPLSEAFVHATTLCVHVLAVVHPIVTTRRWCAKLFVSCTSCLPLQSRSQQDVQYMNGSNHPLLSKVAPFGEKKFSGA